MIDIRFVATRRGLNRVTKALEPQELFNRAYDSLDDSLDEIKRILVPKIPVDTGQTAGNIFTHIDGTTLQDLTGIVASPDFHFRVLEYGRRVGARMPPSPPIEAWAERHGIDLGAVFAIRRAISRRGLPAHHMMQQALDEGRKHFATIWFRRFMEMWEFTGNEVDV